MSGMIKTLYEDGRLLLYVDYRTGSSCNLANGVAPSIVGAPRLAPKRRGLAISTTIANYTQFIGTGLQPSSYGTGVIFLVEQLPLHPSSGYFCITGGGTNRFNLQYTGGKLEVYNGVSTSSSVSAYAAFLFKAKTVGGIFGGVSNCDLFVDGTRYAGNATLTYTADPTEVRIAWGYPLVYAALFFDMNALSDADIARLHRELVAAPGIVRRPTKSFSIPYPAKTPAEYAAEGVIMDLAPIVQGGKVRDVSGNGNDTGAIIGHVDVRRPGVFDSALSFPLGSKAPLSAAINAVVLKRSFTCLAWVKPTNLTVSVGALVGTGFTPLFGRSTARISMQWWDSGVVQRAVNSTGNPLVKDAWVHAGWTLSVSGSNVTAKVYANGVEVGTFSNSTGLWTGTAYTALLNSTSLATNIGFFADIGGLQYFDQMVLGATDIRAEYLEGARTCLLDASVYADGSCPVSLATRVSGEIANGWKILSGTWRTTEDAPAGGSPGGRQLSTVTAGTVYQKQKAAFGSYHFRLLAGTLGVATSNMAFIAASPTGTGLGTGYELHLSTSGRINFRRVTAGVATTLTQAAAGYVAFGVWYDFWVTRRTDGVFSIWIRGGVYTTWTLVSVAGGSGSNPVTDITHTTSEYVNFSGAAADQSRGVRVFLGEMLPSEAIAAGILEA